MNAVSGKFWGCTSTKLIPGPNNWVRVLWDIRRLCLPALKFMKSGSLSAFLWVDLITLKIHLHVGQHKTKPRI